MNNSHLEQLLSQQSVFAKAALDRIKVIDEVVEQLLNEKKALNSIVALYASDEPKEKPLESPKEPPKPKQPDKEPAKPSLETKIVNAYAGNTIKQGWGYHMDIAASIGRTDVDSDNKIIRRSLSRLKKRKELIAVKVFREHPFTKGLVETSLYSVPDRFDLKGKNVNDLSEEELENIGFDDIKPEFQGSFLERLDELGFLIQKPNS